MTDALLGALIIAPLAITFFLKSNAAVGFLALSTGFVLSTSAVGDLKQLLNQMDLTVTETTLALVMISLPLVVTLLLLRSPARSGLLFIAQLVTSLLAGGLLALSVTPLLSLSSDFQLESSQVWKVLQDGQAAIIGAGALVSLILVWAGGVTHHRKKKH